MTTRMPEAASAAAPSVQADVPCRDWYEAHGTAVYGYLRFHLASADEAEDLTADVFLRAVRAADRFDPDPRVAEKLASPDCPQRPPGPPPP